MRFQTKDMDCWMDKYEIREDGTLWKEHYDTEDRSEHALWAKANPDKEPPEGLDKFCGCMSSVNCEWKPENYTGSIRFYDYLDHGHLAMPGWIEFVALFIHGKISHLELIEYRPEAQEQPQPTPK